jgi:hypothetical protein
MGWFCGHKTASVRRRAKLSAIDLTHPLAGQPSIDFGVDCILQTLGKTPSPER